MFGRLALGCKSGEEHNQVAKEPGFVFSWKLDRGVFVVRWQTLADTLAAQVEILKLGSFPTQCCTLHSNTSSLHNTNHFPEIVCKDQRWIPYGRLHRKEQDTSRKDRERERGPYKARVGAFKQVLVGLPL